MRNPLVLIKGFFGGLVGLCFLFLTLGFINVHDHQLFELATSIACGEKLEVSPIIAGKTTAEDASNGTTWFKFQAQNGQAILTLTAHQTALPTVAVFREDGSAMQQLTVDEKVDESEVTIDLSTYSGAQYYIKVSGSWLDHYFLSMDCFDRPLNDKVCQAEPLTIGQTAIVNNVFATATVDEVIPPAGPEGKSCNAKDGWCDFELKLQNTVWFAFTPVDVSCINLVTAGGDLQMAVYTAEDCNNFDTFHLVAANDDGRTGLAPILENLQVESGQTYYIQLDGSHGAKVEAGTLTITPGKACDQVFADCGPHFEATDFDGGLQGEAVFDACKGEFDLATTARKANLAAEGGFFLYTDLCADGEFVVQLGKLSDHAVAGITLRASLDPGAQQVSLLRTRGSDYLQRELRLDDGGAAHQEEYFRPMAKWLKIVRDGDNIMGFCSIDGENWRQVFTTYFPNNGCMKAGMILQSDVPNVKSTAHFENFQLEEYPNLLAEVNSEIQSIPTKNNYLLKAISSFVKELYLA